MIQDHENATTRHCPECVRLADELEAQIDLTATWIYTATMQRDKVETPEAREIICALQAESNDNFERAAKAEAALNATLYIIIGQSGPMDWDTRSVHTTANSAYQAADKLNASLEGRGSSFAVFTAQGIAS